MTAARDGRVSVEPSARDPSSRTPVAASALSPAARLERSREALRGALLQTSDAGAAESARPRSAWADEFAALPLVGPVIDAVRTWWQRHPARTTTALAATAARSVLTPVARRHPVALVAAAAVIGAGIVALKPWRWMTRPAFLAGLASQVASAAIGRIPLETWVSLAATLMASSDAQSGTTRNAESDRANAASSD